MQYPVPQFTDVEDHIIGPLTVKQFGIIFGGGVIIFLVYSATKSVIALIIALLLFGIPSLAIAFAKVNGRPMYNTFPVILRFLTSDKLLVFHREIYHSAQKAKVSQLEVQKQQPIVPAGDAERKLMELNTILEQQAKQQEEIVKKI